MLGFLLGWMLGGLLIMYVVVFTHLLIMERKGFAACDWWRERIPGMLNGINYKVIRFIFGLIIWPIRLIQFLMFIPDTYETYETK